MPKGGMSFPVRERQQEAAVSVVKTAAVVKGVCGERVPGVGRGGGNDVIWRWRCSTGCSGSYCSPAWRLTWQRKLSSCVSDCALKLSVPLG